MSRSLLIVVRFHEGRYHGQEDCFDGADGWPPSPGRLFQALIAGAARGARLPPADELALRWLERLDPPRPLTHKSPPSWSSTPARRRRSTSARVRRSSTRVPVSC